ncbi:MULTISPECIES: DUF1127 domain-containing protein [Aureimonas]|nr:MULTISPECIES: DUF1127 domain-containing protein [Aureimonas]
MTLARLFEDRPQFRLTARERNGFIARELSEIGLSRSDLPSSKRRTAR